MKFVTSRIIALHVYMLCTQEKKKKKDIKISGFSNITEKISQCMNFINAAITVSFVCTLYIKK